MATFHIMQCCISISKANLNSPVVSIYLQLKSNSLTESSDKTKLNQTAVKSSLIHILNSEERIKSHMFSASLTLQPFPVSLFTAGALLTLIVDDMYAHGGYLQVSQDVISLMSCILKENMRKKKINCWYNIIIGLQTAVEYEVKSAFFCYSKSQTFSIPIQQVWTEFLVLSQWLVVTISDIRILKHFL